MRLSTLEFYEFKVISCEPARGMCHFFDRRSNLVRGLTTGIEFDLFSRYTFLFFFPPRYHARRNISRLRIGTKINRRIRSSFIGHRTRLSTDKGNSGNEAKESERNVQTSVPFTTTNWPDDQKMKFLPKRKTKVVSSNPFRGIGKEKSKGIYTGAD